MHPTGFFFAIILLLMVVPPTLWCAVVGGRALWLARRRAEPAAVSLVIIAITLCEPLVSVSVIAYHIFNDPPSGGLGYRESLVYFLRISATMGLILLPAIGLFMREPVSRHALLQLAEVGVLRWLTVLGTFSCMVIGLAPVPLWGTIAGTILLYGTAAWSHDVVESLGTDPQPA